MFTTKPGFSLRALSSCNHLKISPAPTETVFIHQAEMKVEGYLKMNTYFSQCIENINLQLTVEKNLQFSNYEKPNNFPEWRSHSLQNHALFC